MEENNKIAVFDFCETLVKFQSADAYMEYLYFNTRFSWIRCVKFFWVKVLNRIYDFGFGRGKVRRWNFKESKLRVFKGLTYEVMDRCAYRYYNEKIKPNLIEESISILKDLKEKSYCIVIASGAFDIYLKYFCQEYEINLYICTELDFRKSVFEGKWKNHDCMGEEKVHYLSVLLQSQNPALVPKVGFSDSESDVPLLSFCEKSVVVSKNVHQLWADRYGFHEIIWKE